MKQPDKASADATQLHAHQLTLTYGDHPVVEELDLDIPPAAITAIVGPNGCGKSTLLRALARLHPAKDGHVVLKGRDIHTVPTREVARELGILPQSPIAPPGITVRDLVGRGRMPHLRALRPWGPGDAAAVERALTLTNLLDLAERSVESLSGGQRQRAWIALALAQETDLLLLDEPTTFLDIAHQYEVLDLLHRLAAQGRTIVVVLHDLAQAARYAHHLVLMREGRILARGQASEVLTANRVGAAFGLNVTVITDPVTGTPLIVPTSAPAGNASPNVALMPSLTERKS